MSSANVKEIEEIICRNFEKSFQGKVYQVSDEILKLARENGAIGIMALALAGAKMEEGVE